MGGAQPFLTAGTAVNSTQPLLRVCVRAPRGYYLKGMSGWVRAGGGGTGGGVCAQDSGQRQRPYIIETMHSYTLLM